MTNTLSTVKHILSRELLIPARTLRSRQVLTSGVGLSVFELNALLYFIEEKYHVELNTIKSNSTVQELVDHIDQRLSSRKSSTL